MLAVSDTSPISNLAFIGRLDLLRAQFAEVRIPPAVAAELKKHPDKAAKNVIELALREWIRIVTPKDTPFHRMLRRQVDAGEAEAIAAATDIGAAIVIIDEQEGRMLARHAGLSVTGTLGILLRAKRSGHLPLIKPEIQALHTHARFFLSVSLEREVLTAAGE